MNSLTPNYDKTNPSKFNISIAFYTVRLDNKMKQRASLQHAAVSLHIIKMLCFGDSNFTLTFYIYIS